MPLQSLLILVAAGIAGIAALLHLLGRSEPLRFDDAGAARRAWQDEFPDRPVTGVVLAANRRAALIETPQGLGLAWPVGADAAARPLSGARVRRRGDGLDIRLPDITAPRIRLRLDDTEAADWQRRIAAPRAAGDHQPADQKGAHP